MFTGLVDDVGVIERVTGTPAGRELRIACRYDDLREGESIAVNGVCLTVREWGPRFLTAAAVTTTLDVTTIGEWMAGRRVNLERALLPTDRLGGHFVQGHVDGIATVTRAAMEGDAFMVELALPSGLSDLMVDRGAIAVDGVSLTIVGPPDGDRVRLSIIEHTRSHTTLAGLRAGDRVNVEADIIAKHVRQLLKGAGRFERLGD